MDDVSRLNPYLYCLMRTDMDSLNPGKAIAQGIHAGHVFSHYMYQLRDQFVQDWYTPGPMFRDYDEMVAEDIVGTRYFYNRVVKNLTMFHQWEKTSQKTPGFGTTITLDIGGEASLLRVVDVVNKYGCPAGVAHDDEYPISDGEVMHCVPLNTCGYAFGDKDELAFILGQYELHF